MIDIHTHILPGMDDGARNMRDSLNMARLAVESGVHTIIATPHCNIPGFFNNYFDPFFHRLLMKLRQRLSEERIPLRVFSGMEVFTTGDVIDKMEDGRIISLNHSRYYLMEFPFDIMPEVMEDRLLRIAHTGRVPVIAHPERYHCIQDMPQLLYELLDRGCKAQCNKGSFFGYFGESARKTVEVLADYHLIHMVASDAHSPYERTTYMGEIQEYLEERYSYEYAKLLLYDNPNRLIYDQPIPFQGKKIEKKYL